MINKLFQEIKKENTKTRCLILGCGPSLSEINREVIKEMSKDYLIFTIKQSYNEFKDLSDFHFFNCNNLCHYGRSKAKFICCSPNEESSGYWDGQEIDLFYYMSEHPKKMIDINIESFFKEENMGKYWGPGIMTEIVLPFAYNLGMKEIITIGWDQYKNENQGYKHFYPEIFRRGFFNPAAPMYKGENEETIKNSGTINKFFSENGIKLQCLNSEHCNLHSSIERIHL